MSLTIAWTTRWRDDQKEPAARTAAALRGIEQHARTLGCFRDVAIRIIKTQADPATQPVSDVLARLKGDRSERVVVLVIRELGPHLKIGLPELIAGGTEVQFDVRVIDRDSTQELAEGRVRWQRQGAFYLRGSGHLHDDLSEALAATLGAPQHPAGKGSEHPARPAPTKTIPLSP